MLKLKHKFLYFFPLLTIFSWFLFFLYNVFKTTQKFDPREEFTLKNNFSYEIYYSGNTILSKLSRKFNIEDEREEVPVIMRNAFISAEDKRFFEHNGIDFYGSTRAFINNILSGYIREGGSTITQQVARLIFLNNDISFTRKIKEIIISIIMDYKYSKNKILKIYLNEIYLGEGARGISEASQIYFGKLINELTLSEIAMIAGLAPAPNFYSPYQNYNLAINQRNKILNSMYIDGYIIKKTYEDALKEKIKIINKKNDPDNLLIEIILKEARNKINPAFNYKMDNHLIIKSSINKKWQGKAQELSKYLLPEGIEIGLISIESNSGLIKTLITSREPKYNQFNRVTSAIRPLSSTFKIIPYGLAFLEGKNMKDIYDDSPTCWNNYCPKNFSNYYNGKSSLIDAFKTSSNIVPIKISNEFGMRKIINLANLFGLGSHQKLKAYLPMAIGAYGDSLINITKAYSIINNEGKFIKTSFLKKIELKSGEVIWENKFYPQRIIDKKIATKLNFLLEKSVSDGNGIAAYIEGEKIYGKTGTSDLNKDLWFIGSIKNLTTGIWLGFDDNRSTNLSSGIAANFWKTYIQNIDILH